ncbi:MAG: NAD(P)/FAD-dependent oxidoreductase [Bacillota bacterium]
MYDVSIIGAGITGTAIARELSRYQLKIAVFEKEADVGSGVSKANTGIIHAGVTAPPGTLMAGLNLAGAALYERLARDMRVPFMKTGAFLVAFTPEEAKLVEGYFSYGKKAGIKDLRVLSGRSCRELEPGLNPAVVAALDIPATAVINPYQMVIALAENASANGVQFFLNSKIARIDSDLSGFTIYRDAEKIRSRFVINAAGLYADEVARLIGNASFAIRPRKGEYFVLDRSEGPLTSRVIYPVPNPRTKGILIAPTVEGNTLLGPNAAEVADKNDLSTTSRGLAEVWEGAEKLYPHLPAGKIISQYAGLRPAVLEHDFIIAWSKDQSCFMNVAGIQSPGLTSAPAIALLVRDKLSDAGLDLKEKPGFQGERFARPFFRTLSEREQRTAWEKDPDLGEIVCRCESVSRGEIIGAIQSSSGGLSLDAVKRRTRAGQGRCQGSFCFLRILEIMQEISGRTWDQFTKKGADSWLVRKKK